MNGWTNRKNWAAFCEYRMTPIHSIYLVKVVLSYCLRIVGIIRYHQSLGKFILVIKNKYE